MSTRSIVAIVGVHGSGKTHTARLLSRLGYRYIPLEVIDEAYGLDAMQRQILFYTTFTRQYLKATSLKEYKPIVMDSHPLVVIPYTEYWLSKEGYSSLEINNIVSAFKEILLKLPKATILVYLKPRSIQTIIRRLKQRNRFNLEEEANPEYIHFIDEKMGKLVEEIGPKIASRVITIQAELEAAYRALRIHELVSGSHYVKTLIR